MKKEYKKYTESELAKAVSKANSLSPIEAEKIEQAVLGACIVTQDLGTSVMHVVSRVIKSPEYFYNDKHKAIYEAILKLNECKKSHDLLSVTQYLSQVEQLEKIGGAYYLVELTNRINTTANTEYHCLVLRDLYIAREAQKQGMLLATTLNKTEHNYEVQVTKHKQKIESLLSDTQIAQAESFDDMLNAYVKRTHTKALSFNDKVHSFCQSEYGKDLDKCTIGEYERAVKYIRKNDIEHLAGVSTGFKDLDLQLNGLEVGMHVIAGRPGMGKSAFALKIADCIASQGVPCLFGGVEMTNQQTLNRLISQRTKIKGGVLKSGTLTEFELQSLESETDKLKDFPLTLIDTQDVGNSIENFYHQVFAWHNNNCRRRDDEKPTGVFIFDYLQIASTQNNYGANDNAKVQYISNKLRTLAQELNIAVIALSQLSRSNEKRGGMKRPMLSDLRDSGAIEQDAFNVMFVHRPEYYDILEDEDGNSTQGIAEIIVAKGRGSGVGTIKLAFEGQYTNFSSLDADGGYTEAIVDETTGEVKTKNEPSDVPF